MTVEVDITYRRGDFELAIDLALNAPVTGVFGPSGAGKSTFLHLLAGLLCPDAGSIRVDSDPLFDSAARLNLPPHSRRVGVVFQDARLFPHRSVRGNLQFGERLLASGQRRFQFDEIVALLELEPLLDRRPANTSGGERQRIALGRALLASPRLLLLDEPLASLDPGRKDQILPFFRRVRDTLDLPLIYVSHDLSEILRLTENVVVMDRGRAVGSGSYRDVSLSQSFAARSLPGARINVLETRVTHSDLASGCTFVAPTQGSRACSIAIPQGGWDPQSSLSVAVRPEDIALSTSRVDGISVQNQLLGRVERFVRHDGQLLVEVDVGVPLLVELSAGSFERLGLRVGAQVHCLIKSNAFTILDRTPSQRTIGL